VFFGHKAGVNARERRSWVSAPQSVKQRSSANFFEVLLHFAQIDGHLAAEEEQLQV
jgi:hypothetical protein